MGLNPNLGEPPGDAGSWITLIVCMGARRRSRCGLSVTRDGLSALPIVRVLRNVDQYCVLLLLEQVLRPTAWRARTVLVQAGSLRVSRLRLPR